MSWVYSSGGRMVLFAGTPRVRVTERLVFKTADERKELPEK